MHRGGGDTGGGREEAAEEGAEAGAETGAGQLGRGAPPPTAHVLGQAAPGSEADEHARERGKAQGGPGGGGGGLGHVLAQAAREVRV